jgi:hypothetical protein
VHLLALSADRPASAKCIRGSAAAGENHLWPRADSGFYCWDAVEAYENQGVQFIISARKTSRLAEELKAADWKCSPGLMLAEKCEFRYQPEGWGKAYRFLALRYVKKPKPRESGEPEH